MFAKIQRIHFVGIGGIGMSGIAEVLVNLGYAVSGSDLKSSPLTQRLEGLGITLHLGHRPENVAGAQVVVTSSAVSKDNPEVAEAHNRHIPVIPRAEMLSELMRLKYGIAVAGMHGKTTTTSMIAAVLAAGGLDPTVVVGGRVDALGSNARLGKSQYLVAEADESDRSFLKLSPILAVVTNIDREHMDCYRNMRDVKRTFLDFMDRIPFYGTVVACNDDPILRSVLRYARRRTVTYGSRRGSDFRIIAGKPEASGDHRPVSRFRIDLMGLDMGEFTLHVPGTHNVLNATAAIAVGVGLEVSIGHVREALANFRGVDRRFQMRGEISGIAVIDDYGHHPTEIKATLAAARQCGYRRIHVIFQPHRYTRTHALAEEFSTAFQDADTLSVLDIYAASEPPIEGVTSQNLVARIQQAGIHDAMYASSFDEAVRKVISVAQEGDMILTLGAGTVSQLGPMILERLGSIQAAGARN